MRDGEGGRASEGDAGWGVLVREKGEGEGGWGDGERW